MTAATKIYIERVNRDPCGLHTYIQLYAGADPSGSLKKYKTCSNLLERSTKNS